MKGNSRTNPTPNPRARPPRPTRLQTAMDLAPLVTLAVGVATMMWMGVVLSRARPLIRESRWRRIRRRLKHLIPPTPGAAVA